MLSPIPELSERYRTDPALFRTDLTSHSTHSLTLEQYWLSVENSTLAPDGYQRQVLAVNGTLPGPAITGDWGDHFVIHVTNNLENNGSVSSCGELEHKAYRRIGLRFTGTGFAT